MSEEKRACPETESCSTCLYMRCSLDQEPCRSCWSPWALENGKSNWKGVHTG